MKIIKKIACIAGIGMITLVMLFFAADTGLRWWYQHKDKIDDCVQSNFTQYICGVVRCVEICEQNGVDIDDEFEEKIKEYTVELLKRHIEKDISLTELIKLIYLDSYYDLGYEKSLNKTLGKHYAEEEKLFTSYEFLTYVGDGWESDRDLSRSRTIDNLNLLNVSGTYVKDYQIEEGLAEWFNANVGKLAEGTDKEFIEEYEMDFQMVLWYFYKKGELERLDYEKMRKQLKKKAAEGEKELKEIQKNGEIDWNAPMTAKFMSKYKKIYEHDSSWDGLDQQLYKKMDSEEDFWYQATDDTYFWVAIMLLEDIKNLSENTYFTEHINQWLWENLEKSTEQILINGTDFK